MLFRNSFFAVFLLVWGFVLSVRNGACLQVTTAVYGRVERENKDFGLRVSIQCLIFIFSLVLVFLTQIIVGRLGPIETLYAFYYYSDCVFWCQTD